MMHFWELSLPHTHFVACDQSVALENEKVI